MNEEIKDASVDSPELEVLLRRVREAKSWDFDDRKAALIAHINAWADERCNTAINQLAASRAMLPVTDSVQLLQNVVADVLPMLRGSGYPKTADVLEIATREVAASPVAGWVSVEDERKPKLNQQLILFVRTVKYGESDEGRQFEIEGCEIAMGEYRKYGDLEPQFDCFISPISDGDWITHWMPLPAHPHQSPLSRSRAND